MKGGINSRVGIPGQPILPPVLFDRKINITKVLRTPINLHNVCPAGQKFRGLKPIGSVRIWNPTPFQMEFIEKFQERFNRLPSSQELTVFMKAHKLGKDITTLQELSQWAEKFGINILGGRPIKLTSQFITYIKACEPVQVISQTTPEQQVVEQVATVSNETVLLHKCTEFVKSLLVTKPGELLGMPNFGSRLWNELFEVITPRLLDRIRQIIEEDLAAICPDIKKQITVVQDPQDENVVKCRIVLSFESMKMTINASISSGKIEVL